MQGGYDAFISYNQKADSRVAATLQRALHGFARPRYQLRALRVFRDVSSLPANSGLMSTIEGVLRESRFLILLASRNAAKSPWVAREVTFWCDHKSTATLLLVLTDGKIAWDQASGDFDWVKTTALPPILAGRFAEEPLIVDLTRAKRFDRLGTRHLELRETTATLATTIHNRPRDNPIGDDLRRHRRAIQIAVAAAALIVGFAALASWQSVAARSERDKAREQARQATSLALSAASGLQLANRPTTALLLGLEAYRIRGRAEARGAVVAAPQVALRTGAGPILRRHTDIARAVAFSPDGRTLVSVGDDRLVRLWDIEQGREEPRSPLRGHKVSSRRSTWVRTATSLRPDRGTEPCESGISGATSLSDRSSGAAHAWNLSRSTRNSRSSQWHREPTSSFGGGARGNVSTGAGRRRTSRRWRSIPKVVCSPVLGRLGRLLRLGPEVGSDPRAPSRRHRGVRRLQPGWCGPRDRRS